MPEAAFLKKEPRIAKDEFYEHVVAGLASDDKKLHPKYFYDKQGSEYFDQICDLEDYYPYKVELLLLPEVAEDLSEMLSEQYALIEFGAGSLLKVKPVLEKVDGIQQFIPIDISGDHLRDSCRELEQEFSALDVRPIEGDFTQPIKLNGLGALKKIGFFPGSTIGNFTPAEASSFLSNARKSLGSNSYLLVGVDTKKSPKRLHRAYNDEKGITAKFNLNILDRINRRFDNPLDTSKFEHYAFYNTRRGCIEMHLVCLEAHTVYLDDIMVSFEKGESIHTESSFKYSPEEFQVLACKSGWRTEKLWLASDEMFSVFLLRNIDA